MEATANTSTLHLTTVFRGRRERNLLGSGGPSPSAAPDSIKARLFYLEETVHTSTHHRTTVFRGRRGLNLPGCGVQSLSVAQDSIKARLLLILEATANTSTHHRTMVFRGRRGRNLAGIGLQSPSAAQDSIKARLLVVEVVGHSSTPPPTSVSPGSSAPLRPEPTHSPASNRPHPASINSPLPVPWGTPTDSSTCHPTTDSRGYRGEGSRRGWEVRCRRREG